MDLSVAFLGTGGSVGASLDCERAGRPRGDRLMFDCGEGTQRQLQRSLGLVQVDSLFITHFHADHFLGLPGLLKTYDLGDRQALHVYGRGLSELFDAAPRARPRPLSRRADRARAGGDRSGEGYEVLPVEHRTAALGYALVEENRPGSSTRPPPSGSAFPRARRGARSSAARPSPGPTAR